MSKTTKRIGRWGLLCGLLVSALRAAETSVEIIPNGTNVLLSVRGNSDEWRFQVSNDLLLWTNAPSLGSLFGGDVTGSSAIDVSARDRQFVRVVKSDGLFDPSMLRTIHLTFTNANWATLLASARNTGGNVSAFLQLDNGVILTNVGA